MGTMHISRPGARRVLAALRRHGGSATTIEIAETIEHLFGRKVLNVHSDVASLRDYARNTLGVQAPDPVHCEQIRSGRPDPSEPGWKRRPSVYRYTLCAELMRPMQTILFVS